MEIKHDKAATIVIVELCFVLRSVRRVVLSHVQKHGMIDDDDDDDDDDFNNIGPHCFDSSSICKAMFHQDGFFHPSDWPGRCVPSNGWRSHDISCAPVLHWYDIWPHQMCLENSCNPPIVLTLSIFHKLSCNIPWLLVLKNRNFWRRSKPFGQCSRSRSWPIMVSTCQMCTPSLASAVMVRDTRDTPSYPRYPTGGSFLPVWIWLFGGEHMSIHITYIYTNNIITWFFKGQFSAWCGMFS